MSAGDGTLINAFFGPSLQYWTTPHLWLGGGIGLATVRYVGGSCNMDPGIATCAHDGLGLDLRAGYSFGEAANTLNVSVELNPSFYNQVYYYGSYFTVTSFALLVGYQYL